jgi:thioredoxin-related protein
MNSRLIFAFLLLPVFCMAQENSGGTQFQKGLSFEQMKEKAKKEKKYVFVDCSTTWCGWCKKMVAEVFPQEKVGDFMNGNFVSVEVQMDETPKDNDYVKSWRSDADSFAKYVRGYPTYLVFSPDGQLVHSIVGYHVADEFITLAKKSLNPQTQYYTLLRKYERGDKAPGLLYALAMDAADIGDGKNRDKTAGDYLATQQNLYTDKNLKFIAQTTVNTKSKGFEVLLHHSGKVDAVLGKGKAEEAVSGIIMGEEFYKPLMKKGMGSLDLDSLVSIVSAKYPTVDLVQKVSLLKIQVYQQRKDWAKFQPAVLAYMGKYGSSVEPQTLNDFAWTVFENCPDQACVAQAMEWSKKSVAQTGGKDPALLDTYANLLYKSGNTKDAIAMEEKALNIAGESDKPTYKETLDRMQKGGGQ